MVLFKKREIARITKRNLACIKFMETHTHLETYIYFERRQTPYYMKKEYFNENNLLYNEELIQEHLEVGERAMKMYHAIKEEIEKPLRVVYLKKEIKSLKQNLEKKEKELKKLEEE
jgi:lipid A disaccharide synthetase